MHLLLVGVFWFVSVTGGEVTTQKMDAFPLGTWENGDQLLWSGAKVGDRMELATKVETAGRYRLQVVLTKSLDYGIVQFELDGKKVAGQIDLYSDWITATPPIPLGDHRLTAGEHKLAVTIVGKHEKSTGTNVGVDRVILTKCRVLPPALPGAETSQLEELAQLEILPRLRSDERSIMFSSYDRNEGNNDGFSGRYSKLWVEDGNTVLAAMDGPGVVERIWFTHSRKGKYGPSLLDCKGEHIRVYLDGDEKPAIDVPLNDLLTGKISQFPAPLVGMKQGGYYCYVPIPYRDGCKIEVDGTGVRFYHITYTKLPAEKADTITSFSMEMSPGQKAALDRVVKVWSNLGDVASLDLKNVQWTDVELKLEPGKQQKVTLPGGSQMVRAVLLDGDKEQLDAVRDVKMQFRWDGQTKPAVDLTAEFFFCQKFSVKNVCSLLTGANDRGWYNFMPMPYRRSGSLMVRAGAKPVHVKLRIATTLLPTGRNLESLGYFHSAYYESLPTTSDVYHPLLKRDGVGHYIGTYLTTSGTNEKKVPYWLEGDERFWVDGSLDIHGTGTEDYFNCGWYDIRDRLDGPGGLPLHGFPVYRLQDKRDSLATAYRWHVADPVPYKKQIDAKIEHGLVNRMNADYRTVAFYYETMP